MVSVMRMQLRTTVPLPILTPRKRMELMTVPSMKQPSETSELRTTEEGMNFAGTESFTLVYTSRSAKSSLRISELRRSMLASKYATMELTFL